MPSSCFRQWAQARQHHCVHNSHQQCPGLCSPSVSRYGNTIAIWGYCGEFLFLCLRPCQLDGMLCHALAVNVGSFALLCLRGHTSVLQVTLDFEPFMLLLYGFVQQFIPSPGVGFPLVVLGDTADFGGSIQQRPFRFYQADATWVSLIASAAPAVMATGGRLNKKDGLTRYGNSHVKDKTS